MPIRWLRSWCGPLMFHAVMSLQSLQKFNLVAISCPNLYGDQFINTSPEIEAYGG